MDLWRQVVSEWRQLGQQRIARRPQLPAPIQKNRRVELVARERQLIDLSARRDRAQRLPHEERP
jgi:hypothetical protein